MGRKPLKQNLCVDCEKYALKEVKDYFIVTDNLWKEFGVGKGLLCWGCFEKRMGRSFALKDFHKCRANDENPMINALKIGEECHNA